MGGVSIWHWIVVGVVVLLLFGRGKVSELMGDVAKGIKAFKKGMSDDEAAAAAPTAPAKPLEAPVAASATAPAQQQATAAAQTEHKAG
jgi:sec-independent protein translocase protein TatA